MNLLYRVGDNVIDITTGENVQIIERINAWGFSCYKVYSSINEMIYRLNDEDIVTIDNTRISNVNEFLFLLHLSKVRNELSSGIISNLNQDVIPLPPQLHVLRKVLSGSNIRYLLADEVGLGKTIEAGLVFKELKSRGLVKKVLIVCPKGLVTQWALEMQEKFNEKFNIIQPSDFEAIKRVSNTVNVYDHFDQVISPMDSIKPIEKRVGWDSSKVSKYNDERIYSIINGDWDLIIIDEAHRVAGSSGEVSRYKLGSLLASASPYLLLLTATPHSGKTEPFLRLMRLLDESSFPNTNALVNEQVSKFLIRNEKRETVDNEGNKLFKNRITKVIQLNWDEKYSLQKQLYELTTQYVSRKYSKLSNSHKSNFGYLFLLIMMQRLVSSSTRAVRVSLEKRIHALDSKESVDLKLNDKDIADVGFEDLEDLLVSNYNENKEDIDYIKEIIRVAKQAEYQYFDVKIDALFDIVDNHLNSDTGQKIVIFTEFVATQEYICEFLLKKKYSVCFLNGSMSMDERNNVLSDFRLNKSILVSTDAGGEGLNLQFSNVVINYDLPWNPMKIEQRIGRVDRIGQVRDVFVYNIVLSDTVESRVREVLESKLRIILDELGIDKYSDVLDSEVSEANFIKAFMNSIGNPNDIESSLLSIENEFNEQLQNQATFKGVMHQNNNFDDLIGSKWNDSLPFHMQKMVHFYNLSYQDKKIEIDEKELISQGISELIRSAFKADISKNFLRIRLSNLDYEPGYFMMWEISISDTNETKRFIPLFVNKDEVLRPMAGQIIWNKIIDEKVTIEVLEYCFLDKQLLSKLSTLSENFSRKYFDELKDKYLLGIEESIQKFKYAHNLRVEACTKIGIENIRNSRLRKLELNKDKTMTDFEFQKKIYPEFNLITFAYLEV